MTTLAVTFWYAWLFNHASGSSLITLIAHGTEGQHRDQQPVGTGRRPRRLNYVYAAVWCLVALALLVLDRRFWTHRDAPRATETDALATGLITAAEPGAVRQRS